MHSADSFQFTSHNKTIQYARNINSALSREYAVRELRFDNIIATFVNIFDANKNFYINYDEMPYTRDQYIILHYKLHRVFRVS